MARRVESQRELDNSIDDLEEEGWKLKRKTAEKAVMRQNDYGGFGAHILIGLLTIWWAFGLANLAYAAKRFWMNSKKRVIRVSD